FGRDREAAAVLAELTAAPFVLLVGPSGAGKSSLARAAVAPRVAHGALGPGLWRVATLVPGPRPMEALAQAAAGLGLDERETSEQLAAWPGWLGERLAETPGQRVLFVVDQLEEIMTLAARAQP